MAEQVSGQIGQEQVILNNAASETTLRLILEGIKASSKDAASAIDKMAAKAGIDSNTIQAANAEVKKSTTSFKDLKEATDAVVPSFDKMIAVTEQLTKGNAQASEIMQTTFGKSSGVVGLFTTGMIKLAKFQEETLTSYRDLSQAGVNFGGSLTDLRMAASNSYMTLGDFSTMLKSNSQNLLNLGGSVNGGAVAFAKFSNSVLKSELGDQLLALGYTANEANQGMLTYLGAAGISDAKDLQSNEALRKGASEYLNEIDRLAEVTGKSRKEQEETMKRQKLDAEIQMTASRMQDPAQRAAFEANVKYMTEQFGDAGKDMALAQAQGRSVITKEGQTLTALAPGMTESYQRMVQAGNQFGIGSKQYISAQNDMLLATKNGFDKLPIATVSATDSIKRLSQVQLTVSKMTEQGLDTKEKLDARDTRVAEEKKKREDSQAKAAAETQKAFQELGQSILATLLPVVSKIVPVFNAIIQNTLGLKTVIVSLTAAFVAYKAIQLAQTGAEKLKQVRESGLAEAFKKTTFGQLGSKEKPMYVIVVGGGAGAGGLEDLLDRKNKTGSNSLEKVKSGGSARGALKGIKGAGIVGALAGAAMLGGDLMSISDRLKNKEITEAEASKERGGAVGETGGGLAGGLAGAAAGAAIGSVVPVIGTAIGGIVGGMIGGFGGGALGKMIGEGIMGPSKEKPKMASGGIATQATAVTVGEAGPEAIIPLTKFENLQVELATLNTSMHEVIKYMKDTAENTKRTHDATKALNGDWFAR